MDSYEGNNLSETKLKPEVKRGGLIPITAHIINSAEINEEEQTVEFQRVTISDFTATGYVVDYQETDTKIKLTIYDYTGLIEVNFYSKQDGQEHGDLDKSNFENKRVAVQIFGTAKVSHKKKYIQGAKVLISNSNNIMYHKAKVIHSWLYLTGKLQEMRDNNLDRATQETRNFSSNSNYRNEKKSTPTKIDEEEIAAKIIENYVKKENTSEIPTNKMMDLLRRFGNKSSEIISKLIESNKIIDNDGSYEIL